MYLTKDEERALDGEYGLALQRAYQILVTLGDVLGADKLISVRSAQIAGVSYKNIGDAGLEFLEDFAASGARVSVPSTLNPAGMDLDRWREMHIDEEFARKQLRIIEAFRKMGVRITCTCTPYLAGNRPSYGSHIAWSESSAVTYVNSVLGARTNREGGISALAAAIAGKVPRMGLHLPENRVPNVKVRIEASIKGVLEAGLLGYAIGELYPGKVPLIEGKLKKRVDYLKAFSAAIATSGGIALFHMKGITPEFSNLQGTMDFEDKRVIDQHDLRETLEKLASPMHDVDLVAIGCPHCSIAELREIAELVKGVKVRRRLWVFTSKEVYLEAFKRGYVRIIEKAGGKVFSDTCVVVAPIERLHVKAVATNSVKATHYLPSTANCKVLLTDTRACIEIALER